MSNRVPSQLAQDVQERLLEVVVALRRDIVILQVLLAVELNVLGLDLAILGVNLVAAQDDRDVLADTSQILVPLGNTVQRWNKHQGLRCPIYLL